MSNAAENPTLRFLCSIDPKLDRIGGDVRVRSVCSETVAPVWRLDAACKRRNALRFSALRPPSAIGRCFDLIDEHTP